MTRDQNQAQRPAEDQAPSCGVAKGGTPGRAIYGGVAALLAVHAALLAWGAWRHSPTWDERAYLPAGISHWQLRHFEFYRANPPLVRMIAALPVMLARPETNWDDSVNPFGVGNDFLEANGERSFWLFTLARWVCIPLSLLGGFVCFKWARELFGNPAGILAVTLWCFSPNLIAHGQLITPDTATAALGLSAAYLFWRWLKRPNWKSTLITGLVLGLAELAKATWITLFVLWPLLWVIWRWPQRRGLSRQDWLGQLGQLLLVFLLAIYMINMGYTFDGSLKMLGSYEFRSRILGGERPAGEWGNRFKDTWLGSMPVPLPEKYVLGIDGQKKNFGRAQWSYLGGVWRKGGRWYYYIYALAIKVPLGTWVLLVLAVLAAARDRRYRASWRDELVLLAPLMVVLALVSSQTGFNRHFRYVLPFFPFAFMLASRLGRAVSFRHWKTASVAGVALVWSVGSSLWVYPHSLSYFNELVGGPTGGADHLSASSVDWGQDLLYLRDWLDEHPQARPLWLGYDGGYGPWRVGIDYPPPPPGPNWRPKVDREPHENGPYPGWYAVSVNILHWRDKKYGYLEHFQPVDTIGYTTNIYHVTPDEANRVRLELGLPPWDPAKEPSDSFGKTPHLDRPPNSVPDEAGAE